ncbi:hypothetical protein H5410_005234 [Solanum commersonii]|uniref:Uncharacterized protein n=1 Tax=Solanum commersonii TaxID=4109 RepID=A0A9J6A6L3_SOLCO|nr:hypothetical protein H5410_005234 [Solanum commersonii]
MKELTRNCYECVYSLIKEFQADHLSDELGISTQSYDGCSEAPNVTTVRQPTSSTWGGTELAELVEVRDVMPLQGIIAPLLKLQESSLRKEALVHLHHHRRMLLLGTCLRAESHREFGQ